MAESTLTRLPNKGTIFSKSIPGDLGKHNIDDSVSKEVEYILVFVDESLIMQAKPSLGYYRKLYTDAGYSPDMIASLLEGLSKSSLYEGKAT